MLVPPDTYPFQAAIDAAGVGPGYSSPTSAPDAWMAALGGLPLLHQPGEGWVYDTGSHVLAVLVARVSSGSFGAFLDERVFGPLGMTDTGYAVEEVEPAADESWTRPPAFEGGATGLVSTAADYLTFARMLLARGSHPGGRILSRRAVDLMTSDQLRPAQRADAEAFLEPGVGGLGLGVDVRRAQLWQTPGRFGWDGGTGTSAWTDPAEDLVGILLTQRLMDSPEPPTVLTDFWLRLYAALP